MCNQPIWVETPETFRVDDAFMAAIVTPADEAGKTNLIVLAKQGGALTIALDFAQATRIADGLTSLKHRRRK